MSELKYRTVSARSKEKKILEVIMAYARLDFSQKTKIGNEGDIFDAISAGVNMLGEELKNSTVSLREKEQLLREIHHRVKNNLQIISSLLSLQTYNEKDKKFLSLIRESRNRIKSMALVHEMLYSTSDLSRVQLNNYIKTLCKSIYESYRRPKMQIIFSFNINEGVYFDIDRMIPLGLILNEIISNSLKHAFPENKGTISISLKNVKNNYSLTIQDDGKGLPAGFSVKKHSNLGMQLIFMLGEQLNAKVNMHGKKGISYKIQF
ncbi:MAG TPA: histidine kinase dimerization/phosphoacceptor domain -containing protein [Bacteroidia bacterium]|jgi:two-component sensor histidine kinase|nr:histidine kinase dimerization/phosphoacceptor domain -containing protein [Bacteroidia bacterium]